MPRCPPELPPAASERRRQRVRAPGPVRGAGCTQPGRGHPGRPPQVSGTLCHFSRTHVLRALCRMGGGACFCLTPTDLCVWGLGGNVPSGSWAPVTTGHAQCRCGSKTEPLHVTSCDKGPAKWQSHRHFRQRKPSGFSHRADGRRRMQRTAARGADRATVRGGCGAPWSGVAGSSLHTGPGRGG